MCQIHMTQVAKGCAIYKSRLFINNVFEHKSKNYTDLQECNAMGKFRSLGLIDSCSRCPYFKCL